MTGVQDQPFGTNFEVRLGGTLDDLGEFQEGKAILRLGLETDVAVSKSIYGKIIRLISLCFHSFSNLMFLTHALHKTKFFHSNRTMELH